MEILNSRELAKVVEGVESSKGHKTLLKALHHRYPAAEFRLVCHGRTAYRDGGIVSADGKDRIADFRKSWVEAEFKSAGRDAHSVWGKYKDSGYLSAECLSVQLCITMPYGRDADAYFQIEVDAIHEIATRPLFSKDCPPLRNLQVLQNPLPSCLKKPVELKPWHYQLANVTNIRRFLSKVTEAQQRERIASVPELQNIYFGDGPTTIEKKLSLDTLPGDWLGGPGAKSRLISDWNASSAGKNGHRFCDHWALEVLDDEDDDGTRYLGYVPRLSDRATKLPVIVSSRAGSHRLLVEKLIKFDKRAGYPMAWYFHLVHGGKIDYGVGNRVMNCLQEGEINLPTHDLEILLKWYQRPYGF